MPDKKLLTLSRIGIIKLSSLGDIIHTLPAFHLLRMHYPRAKISWFVEPAGARLLNNFSGIDEIIVIDFKKKGIRNKIREIRRIKEKYRRKLDLVIDFQGLLKSAVLSRLLKCPSISFHPRNLKEPWAKYFYTYKSDFFTESRHVIFKNIEVLKLLGIHDQKIRYPWIKIRQKSQVQQFMDDYLLEPKKFIILNVGGGWKSKILDLVQNQKIANRLKKKYKIVLLWGNEREKKVAEKISEATHSTMGIFFDFPELIDFIKKSCLVITADTLAMHIADMVKIPTVGIFGPTAPERNGSLLKDSISVYEKLPCGFCYKKKCDTMRCLKNLDLDKIGEAVKVIYEKFN